MLARAGLLGAARPLGGARPGAPLLGLGARHFARASIFKNRPGKGPKPKDEVLPDPTVPSVAPTLHFQKHFQKRAIVAKEDELQEPMKDAEGRELIKLRRGGFAPKLREIQVRRQKIPTSVKKLGLLTRLIRDMDVEQAMTQLRYSRKARSADIMAQLVEGAARAKELHGLQPSDLKVAVAHIGKGPMLKRIDIKGRGRTGMITRPCCHLTLVLREIDHHSTDPWRPSGLRKRGHRDEVRKYKYQKGRAIQPVNVVLRRKADQRLEPHPTAPPPAQPTPRPGPSA